MGLERLTVEVVEWIDIYGIMLFSPNSGLTSWEEIDGAGSA